MPVSASSVELCRARAFPMHVSTVARLFAGALPVCTHVCTRPRCTLSAHRGCGPRGVRGKRQCGVQGSGPCGVRSWRPCGSPQGPRPPSRPERIGQISTGHGTYLAVPGTDLAGRKRHLEILRSDVHLEVLRSVCAPAEQRTLPPELVTARHATGHVTHHCTAEGRRLRTE
eukprot:3121297-Rhodomonas_salina.1